MRDHPTSPSAPVLAFETSCDETAVAVVGAQGLLAHRLHSQVALHAEYGGVVPELASRDHVVRLLPLAKSVLAETGLKPHDLGGIAYTAGPGLIGALMVGAACAAGLAAGLDLPLIAVHHMEGHLLAPLLEAEPPAFPFVALLVSGGHTLLVDVRGVGAYRLLGESLDDAWARPSTRPPSCSACPTPAGRSWRGWRRPARRAATACRAR